MIGTIIGGFAQADAAKKAAKAQADALAEQRARLDGITVPEAKRLIVEELVQQGQLTPEMQEAFQLPPSEVAKIQEDNSLRQKQTQALELIGQRAQGGLSASDRASYNELRNAVARDQQAKQAQILQQMQARGMGGSGAELAAQLAQSQSSAQDASEQADRLAAQASQNAINAAALLGTQAGALRGQDFNVANTKASAMDEYNRFNTQNMQNVANVNVGARNAAQQYNLGEKQRIADTNVGNRRSEDLRYQQALQNQFQNQWMKATGQNAITAAQGQNQANQALSQGQIIAGVGKAADDTAYKVGGSMLAMSDARAKKDIKKFDSKKFLDKVVGTKYQYNDPKHGQGEQTGVLAQDLEKSPEGAALIVETPEGKAVDYAKAGPLMLASIAGLNERLNEVEGKKGKQNG
jgi:hypothetical protein